MGRRAPGHQINLSSMTVPHLGGNVNAREYSWIRECKSFSVMFMFMIFQQIIHQSMSTLYSEIYLREETGHPYSRCLYFSNVFLNNMNHSMTLVIMALQSIIISFVVFYFSQIAPFRLLCSTQSWSGKGIAEYTMTTKVSLFCKN